MFRQNHRLAFCYFLEAVLFELDRLSLPILEIAFLSNVKYLLSRFYSSFFQTFPLKLEASRCFEFHFCVHLVHPNNNFLDSFLKAVRL